MHHSIRNPMTDLPLRKVYTYHSLTYKGIIKKVVAVREIANSFTATRCTGQDNVSQPLRCAFQEHSTLSSAEYSSKRESLYVILVLDYVMGYS